MKKEDIEQVQRIVDSLVRVGAKMADEKKMDVAVAINRMLERSKKWAYPKKRGWSKAYTDGYTNALDGLKKELGFKGTIYELYQ